MTSKNQNRMVWAFGVAATLAFATVTVDAYSHPTFAPAVFYGHAVPAIPSLVRTIELDPVVITVKAPAKAHRVVVQRALCGAFQERPLGQGVGSVRGFCI